MTERLTREPTREMQVAGGNVLKPHLDEPMINLRLATAAYKAMLAAAPQAEQTEAAPVAAGMDSTAALIARLKHRAQAMGGAVFDWELNKKLFLEAAALLQAREGDARDAQAWREHCHALREATRPGALHIRLTMGESASGTGQAWGCEYIMDMEKYGKTKLGVKAIGLATEEKAIQLFAAIDAALRDGGKG